MDWQNSFDAEFQETTSWWERIKWAFFWIIFGWILILIWWMILWNNEQDFVRMKNDLIFMKNNTQIYSSGSTQSGLILVWGSLLSQETLKNPIFWVTASGALSLKMEVETYQWVEKKSSHSSKNLWGSQTTTTRYSYDKQWSSTYHNADTFHSSGMYNPPVKYERSQLFSQDIKLNGMNVSQDFLNNISSSDYLPLEIPEWVIKKSQIRLKQNISSFQSGALYIGTWSYEMPNVGDTLIRFSYLPSQTYTLIGDMSNNSLTPYTTKNGREIIPIEKWLQSLEHMYKTQDDINIFTTWLMRWVGMILIFIWFTLVFNLIVVLADFIPFFGSIVSFGITMISLFLTLILGGSIIAISWFYARPWYAAIFWWVIILIFYFLKRKRDTSIDQTASFSQSF